MLNEDFFNKLKEQVQQYFEPTGGHEIEHTERVYRLALTIAKTEKNVDLDILRASALLHDIARKKQEEMNDTICHATEGGKMARELLIKTEFPKEKIGAVSYAIESHRYSKGIKPTTIEAEILQDADRLEALGAVAISRIFAYNGKRNVKVHDPKIHPKEKYEDSQNTTAINHFYEKILKIKPETFNTKKGRELAKERYEFIKEFLDRFVKEWEGKE
jgi:uncharacterized protein